MTSEQRTFFYSRSPGLILLILYIPMTAGFAFAATFAHESAIYTVCMSAATVLCLLAIYYLYAKWVSPAYKNQFAVELNDKTLELRAKNLSIAWEEIESITSKHAEYGSIIGVTLKNPEAFLNNLGKPGKVWQYKLNFFFYKHHIGISTLMIKGESSIIFNSINDFFNRFRLGAPPFFHNREHM